MEKTTPPSAQLTTLPPASALPVSNVELTAENGDEMNQCQQALIHWCRNKIKETSQQARDLRGAVQHALKRKWKVSTLKRHADMAAQRQDFYTRLLTALEHGYQIVPPFPITAFAIRTNRKNPLRLYTTHYSQEHTQKAPGLPAGKGTYQNPFPQVSEKQVVPQTATTHEIMAYWAEAWKQLEFPITMAKPQIMEATSRAMALKIFDEIGVLPGAIPDEGKRPPKGDPLILATIIVPHWPDRYLPPRRVSFIIAWHLNTKSLC